MTPKFSVLFVIKVMSFQNNLDSLFIHFGCLVLSSPNVKSFTLQGPYHQYGMYTLDGSPIEIVKTHNI